MGVVGVVWKSYKRVNKIKAQLVKMTESGMGRNGHATQSQVQVQVQKLKHKLTLNLFGITFLRCLG